MMNCPYFKKCGACKYPLDNYEASLKAKVAAISQYLDVEEVVANPQIYHYRHKIVYRFFKDRSQVKAGLYAEGSGKLVAVDNCLLEHPLGTKILKAVLKLANHYHMPVYNPLNGQGFLRYLVLRISKNGHANVCLVVGNMIFESSRHFVREIKKACPEMVNFDLLINKRNTTIVLEGTLKTLFGKGYLRDNLGDFQFLIGSKTFYQVNPSMADIIYHKLRQRLKVTRDEVVLDAYCGIGTISLYLAQEAKKVIGVDINPSSIAGAKANAVLNNCHNVSFIASDVKDLAYSEDYDVLVVDPPRSGLGEDFIKMILDKKPKRIAYVSCFPPSLKEDMTKLAKAYTFEPVTLFDQFGFTDHMEALSIANLH